MLIKHHDSDVFDVFDVLRLCMGDVRDEFPLIDPHDLNS
jgi:hypothetical protein